jgi:putative ABC transport system permease protein
MPKGLDYPRGTDFWTAVLPSTSPADKGAIALDVIGRLAPVATIASARDELTRFFSNAATLPWQRELHGVAHTLPEEVLGDTRPALFVFAAASALLLLITCINVANLLLVRGIARTREIAVRSALGAGRGRIAGLLLTESSVLGVMGGALGVAVAATAVRAFVAFAPAGLPRLDEIELNTSALAGAIGITVLATLLFAFAPTITSTRVEVQQVLRSGERRSASRRSRFLAESLVAGQVALALLVLSAAGLIARSLLELERAKLSLDPSHLLIGELAIRFDQFDSTSKQLALLQTLEKRLEATAGIRSV